MAFDPNNHLIQLKSKEGNKDYLPVQYRLVWVNDDYATKHFQKLEITIKDKVIDLDREISKEIYAWNNETRRSEKVKKMDTGYAYYEMRVELIDCDGNVKIGEGSKSECAVDFPDYAEKAQTGAIGRALASIGYGTQFAPELNEEHRIVDAPVERTPQDNNSRTSAPVERSQPSQADQDVRRSKHTQNTSTSSESSPTDSGITEQQVSSIRILCQKLGRRPPEDLEQKTFLEAKSLIGELNTHYRDSRKAS